MVKIQIPTKLVPTTDIVFSFAKHSEILDSQQIYCSYNFPKRPVSEQDNEFNFYMKKQPEMEVWLK
jgi:hypothetical protein